MRRNITVPITLLVTEGPAKRDMTEPGSDATMPPKMMMEMPFPIPNSVMSSPIQTSSIVPAVMVNNVARVGRIVAEFPKPNPSISGRPSGPVCCENNTA
jgi:hypothetical protein